MNWEPVQFILFLLYYVTFKTLVTKFFVALKRKKKKNGDMYGPAKT